MLINNYIINGVILAEASVIY